MRALPAIIMSATLAVAPGLFTTNATAQLTQYRSPGGVTYTSLPDDGTVFRAESVVEADPQNVDLLLQLGLAQAGIRRYREAIATFTRAIELDPNTAQLYRWRGHRNLSVRQFDESRIDLERALALDANNYGALYHLGIVRYVTGDFEGAAELFRRAIPLAPDPGEHAGSIDWLWMSLSRAGRSYDAQAVLDENSNPPIENAYVQRLQLYRGLVGPEEVFTPADTADVAEATLSYGIGNWYLVQGDTTRAREWFERSVRSGGWPGFGFIASEAELRR